MKIGSDRGAVFYKSIFQNLLKVKTKHSTFQDSHIKASERVNKIIRKSIKEPVFEKQMLIVGVINHPSLKKT